ncbi:hypothetical protein O181_047573 [Austropuccinia psidii MF-1]|uniref:Uncharacterized protein n=1 Tax=Austropuccinia psidii MF-1 TaxID=1389203 RepID=A0A9Q3DU88_9BASI|nr:hypothetical protein [Austropuccinia psidii MF-1]
MQVYVGEEGHEIIALVDKVSELSIMLEDSAIKAGLTKRSLNMNLRQISGHFSSIVELSEFTPITLVSGEGINIHLFVARGAVNTVLGRPFLAENNIRLELSQQKGEILSYMQPDGRRILLPICPPQEVGWREKPQEFMEAHESATVKGYNSTNIEDKESLGNIGSNIICFKNTESPKGTQTLTNKPREKTTSEHLIGILDSEKQSTRRGESLIKTSYQDSILTEEQGVIQIEFNKISQGEVILKEISSITSKDPNYTLVTYNKHLESRLSPKKLVKTIFKRIKK